MEKFTTLEGVAAPLKIINVDTDMIIPKQYLKTIKRTGLGKGLFSEQRYKDDGSENPDFVLNQPAYRNAKVLVAGDNFGCGSSREHAPWALLDFGIRCVPLSNLHDNSSVDPDDRDNGQQSRQFQGNPSNRNRPAMNGPARSLR